MVDRKQWFFGALVVLLVGAPAWLVSPRHTGTDALHASAVLSVGVSSPAASSGGPSASPVPTTEVSARTLLQPARRDPFLIPTPPPPPPAPVAYVAPPPVLAAPVMPSQPPLSLAFTGGMVAPDGRVVVLAQWGDGTPVTLSQGKVLANGYRVERMSTSLVELLNPQTQAVVQLPLPPAPRFETR